MKTEKLGVVLLTTGELAKKDEIALNKDINNLFIPTMPCFIHKKQHLYFTANADVKISKGNWVYDRAHNRILRFDDLIVNGGSCSDHCVKVEATTDNFIIPEKDEFSSAVHWVPRIPTDYVQEYIKSYNEGNILTEVEVDVEDKASLTDQSIGIYHGDSIAMTSDNYIIISKQKDLIIKEDMICPVCNLGGGIESGDENPEPVLSTTCNAGIEKGTIIGKPLDDYIRAKHTQEECIGFIDGYNKAKEEVSNSISNILGYLNTPIGRRKYPELINDFVALTDFVSKEEEMHSKEKLTNLLNDYKTSNRLGEKSFYEWFKESLK